VAIALLIATATAVFTLAHPYSASHARSSDVGADALGSGVVSQDRVVSRLGAYVEQARGLRFLRPVPVTRIDAAAFRARLGSASLVDLADALRPTATMRALGLVAGDRERAAESGQREADVVGLYDLGSKQVYLRDDVPDSPYLRFVLVHELTHALQDQHFDLSRAYGDNADAVLAAISLVEGDAEQVARSYVSSLPPRTIDAVEQEALSRKDELYQGLYLQSADSFPYVAGESFVRQFLERGGQARLDAAFVSYPDSTEQILHVDRYLSGDQPIPVDEPPAGGPVVERGVLGEFDLVSVLLAGGVDVSTATHAGEGWGGARFVTWLDHGTACARVRVVMDTSAATAALSAAVHTWIGRRRDTASLTGSGPLVLTACA
jgi:hypothetical protein